MSRDLDTFYESTTKRINQLRETRTEHEEILDFYEKVLRAQREVQAETIIAELQLPEEHVETKIQAGFALFDREQFPVDKETGNHLFVKLCQLSQDENPLLAGAAKAFLEALESGKLDLAVVFTAVLTGRKEQVDEIAAGLEAPAAILLTLGKLSLQPSLLAVARQGAQRVSLDTWRYSYCPICAAPPAIAALSGEEGKRLALCSFCGHYWVLPRIGCPFCGTVKPGDLKYFYGEGEDLHRVQVCEKCRGYLKIVDIRHGGDIQGLAVDDIATSHLDLLAEKEGYRRKAPRLLGV
jgi:FdhE protein